MQSVTTVSGFSAAAGDAAGALGGAVAVSLVALLVQLIVVAGVYVWTALALAAVFRKTDRPAARAWVPVLNLWTLFELAGMKGWWAAVLVGGGILTALLSSFTSGLFLQSAQEAAFGGGTDAAGALLAATIVPTLLFLVFAAGAVVLMIRMMGPLNRGFDRGGGFVVLGTLLLPVWASLIGWGSARWQGIGRGGLPPTPFAASEAAPAASAPVDTTTFAPPATASAVPSAPAAAAAPAWTPPPLAPSALATPTPFTAPAPATPLPPWPTPPEPAPAPEIDEHTVIAAHRRPIASLRLPNGQTMTLTADAVVLGRNPAPPADAPEAAAVPVDDATRTVSKTHALLRRTETGWTITDLASTNGVIVGDGETEIAAGTPVTVTGRFLLGDAEFTLDAGAR
jgi:hypothetical protein